MRFTLVGRNDKLAMPRVTSRRVLLKRHFNVAGANFLAIEAGQRMHG